jgi:hypothetical protein
MADKDHKDPLTQLQDDLYRTKCARFNADERLRIEHKLAHFSLMFLAVYIVALSVAPAFQVLSWASGNDIDFWSLILSIVLLGIAALEASDNRLEKASRLHENALKIDNLYRKTKTLDKDKITKIELSDLTEEYAAILADCQFNHCEIDVLRNNFSNSWLDGGVRFLSFLGWFLLSLKHYGLYWLIIFGPPMFLLLNL